MAQMPYQQQFGYLVDEIVCKSCGFTGEGIRFTRQSIDAILNALRDDRTPITHRLRRLVWLAVLCTSVDDGKVEDNIKTYGDAARIIASVADEIDMPLVEAVLA